MGFFLSHVSYNDETWHSYTWPKEDPKNIWIAWHNPCVLLTLGFSTENYEIFVIWRNIDIDCILIHNS